MADSPGWMLYGANGFTGRLITAESVGRGMKPILAGRSADKIERLGQDADCPCRVFSLTSVDEVVKHLDGVSAVLHCAGPFSQTARPMMEACIARGVHYLDITGEIDVIEWASQQSDRARTAGVTLLPAVGMDVVPSDCLAALLSESLPNAVRLELAFSGELSVSPGTAKTIWQDIHRGGQVRQDGQIVRVPAGWKTLEVPFSRKSRLAMTIPWGDVASAYHTTGIPNIEVYAALSRKQITQTRRFRWLVAMAGLPPVQWMGRRWIERRVSGPDEKELLHGRTEFWGRVTDGDGRTAEATLETPNGYTLTVQTSLAVLKQVLDGHVAPGFFTPAKAFGSDFIRQFSDVTLEWINRPES